MFETSSVASHTHRAISYKALPLSVTIHLLAAGGVVFAAVQNLRFPTNPPFMSVAYSLTEMPSPPPPPPPPPAAPKLEPVPYAKPATVAVQEEFAPTVIPDQVLPAVTAIVSDVTTPGLGSPTGVEGGVAGGVMGGIVGGEDDGLLGGEKGGQGEIVGGVDDGRVIVPRDEPLRMTALSHTYPSYPEKARLQRWEDRLVVRYVIGTNGRVKEVIILEPASRKVFDEAALAAIRHWRFRPLVEDGQAKEVVHELTVYYRLQV